MQSCEISLIVRGFKVEHDVISDVLSMQPTRILKTNQQLSSVLPPIEQNVWIKSCKYDSSYSLEMAISNFLDNMNLNVEAISHVSNMGLVCLRIYMQYDEAQIFWKLSNALINRICNLGIDVETSILSWGMVSDNAE